MHHTDRRTPATLGQSRYTQWPTTTVYINK